MNSIAVRQAGLSDLEALAGLFDRYRQFQGEASDPAAARRFLQARLSQGESVVFMAHDTAMPVGFAQLYPSWSSVSLAPVFILNDLFVDESGRRRGVASGLLAAVESYAWARSAARVTLNVARANLSAQRLYEVCGWRPDTQHFMYHRLPDRSSARG